MSDDERSPRKPFGSRSGDERQQPFGSRSYRRRDSSDGPRPSDPYPDFQQHRRQQPIPPEPPPEEQESNPEDEPVYEEEEAYPLEEDVIATEPAPPQPVPQPAPQQEQFQPDYVETDDRVALNPLIMARSFGIIIIGALVTATMFTWWSPNAFLPGASVEQLSVALATQSADQLAQQATIAPRAETLIPPTATPLPPELNRIGIVSGHLGLNPVSGLPDPGAVCPDGLTERDINFEVASRVVEGLEAEGYAVDLLEEFDERLPGYEALAMVSIHADSCEDFGAAGATGYKVASFLETATEEEDDMLVRCLSRRYEEATSLTFHQSITYDMTQYHSFREIATQTPGVIIELGFMFADREFLTTQPDVAAQGVIDGILCYIDGDLLEEAEEPPQTENAITGEPGE